MGFRHRRIGLAIFILAVVGVGLTLGLSGAVHPETIRIVGDSTQPPDEYGELLNGTTVGYHDNFTGWRINPSPSANAIIDQNASLLNVSGSFQSVTISAAVTISKNTNINLTAFPILSVQINVTTGVGYGFRFFAKYPNQTQYNVWWEGSSLDHRPGIGYETIRVNMIRQAQLATGHPVSTLTKMEIYVELPANHHTNYDLSLLKLDFINETVVPLRNGVEYRAIYLGLNAAPEENSSWQLNGINFGITMRATAGTVYGIYLVSSSSIYTAANSQRVTYQPLTPSFQFALYPDRQVALFPDILPPGNISIVFSVVVGSIDSISVSYIDFVFLPTQTSTGLILSTQSLGLYYDYFILFLFLIPVGVALLVFHRFLHQPAISKSDIAFVLGIGILCRFALAATTAHVSDTIIYLTSARAWFQYGNPSGSLGPTLPSTFFLYWVGYSPYAVLQMLGFQDFAFLAHAAGLVESIFIKLFPITSDIGVFLLLLRFKNDGKTFVWSTFYILNPLSIFISAVWGQYEAASIAFIILGIYLAHNQKIALAGTAFVASGILELIGFIPYSLLFLTTIWGRKFRTVASLLATLVLAFVYPPETSLLYRLLLAFVGLTGSLTYASPGRYTLIGSFGFSSVASNLHLLIISGTALLAFAFLSNYKSRLSLDSIVLYTGLAITAILLFSGPVAPWLWLVPLAIVYAILKNKDSLAVFSLVFGTGLTFAMESHLTGSAYFLLGRVGYAIQPAIEAVRNGLQIYTVTATFLAVLLLYLFVASGLGKAKRTLVVTSVLMVCVYLLTYFWLGVYSA